MARKRRSPPLTPSPSLTAPPSPPPPQESSASEGSGSDTDDEEWSLRPRGSQMPPQSPRSEPESDSDAGEHASPKSPVTRSATKPAAAASQSESDFDSDEEEEEEEGDEEEEEEEGDEEEDEDEALGSDAGTQQRFQASPLRFLNKPAAPAPQPDPSSSSKSVQEVPEPVSKVVATEKTNTVVQQDKNKPAPPPSPSTGKVKKRKAKVDGSQVDNEEEDGGSLEPEVSEPLPKKVLATKKTNTAVQQDKNKPAPAPSPSTGKVKKRKAKVDGPQAEPVVDGEEEEGESVESEPVAPEPVSKKALAVKKTNTVAQQDKNKPAPAPSPSTGKVKKRKAKVDGPQAELVVDGEEEEDQSLVSEHEVSESVSKKALAANKTNTAVQQDKNKPAPPPSPSTSKLKNKKAKVIGPQAEPMVNHVVEEGKSLESEPEVPVSVSKKALAANKTNTAVQQDKNKPAPPPSPSTGKVNNKKAKVNGPQAEPIVDHEVEEGKSMESEQQGKVMPRPRKSVAKRYRKPVPEDASLGTPKKKAKVDGGIVEPEAAPISKGKEKAEAELESVPRRQTRSATGNISGGKLEKSGIDPSSSSKLTRAHRKWTNNDAIKILETLAEYVQRKSMFPDNKHLHRLVASHLERQGSTATEVYDKVRSIKRKYKKGVAPVGEFQNQVYQLSEAIWGQKATEAIAAAAAASKKSQAVVVEADGDGKSKLLEEETATATKNGDVLTKGKGRKQDKEALTGNHNVGAGDQEENPEEDGGRAFVQGTQRNFHELQKLYPGLAACVDRLNAPHGETLKGAFCFIGDEEAKTMESKIEAQRKSKAQTYLRLLDIKQRILKMLLERTAEGA